jgi:hypothetical protein
MSVKWLKRLICKIFGHKWESYAYMPYGGYYSYDLQQAGHCKRCGADTNHND